MKIVYAAYSTCCQNKMGGVQNRLRIISDMVKKRGFDVELFNPFKTKLNKGDVLHIFKLSFETENLIQYASTHGVKIVISTIVPLIDENKLSLYKFIYKLPMVTTYKLDRMCLDYADALITETQRESDFLSNFYNVNPKKVHVITNGFEKLENVGDEIYNVLGSRFNYVLQVGRFDKNKNQLNVIKALKQTQINLVFIGGPGDDTYYQSCIKEAKGFGNIHFIGWLESTSKILQSAYQNADLLILPSFYETFGMVAVEGASCGTKLVMSNTLPITDFDVFKDCHCFSPACINSIRESVLSALKEPLDKQFTENVISFFDWTRIIDMHIALYENL